MVGSQISSGVVWHEEVDSVWLLESSYELQDEGMIGLLHDGFFKDQILYQIILDNKIFPHALQG
jgi:hypothetical protein